MTSGESPPVRPTQRCLKDIGVPISDLTRPLHGIDHPLVRDGQRLPEQVASGSGERIVSLTDRVWFKHRSRRLRAAVLHLAEAEVADDVVPLEPAGRWWLGAAGVRKEGSREDFYASLLHEAQLQGSRKHPTTDHLLPQPWDIRRLVAEHAVSWHGELRRMVLTIVAKSLRSGKLVVAEYRSHRVMALVRAESRDECYIVITAEGVPDAQVFALILDTIPGIATDDWQPEPGGVTGIEPGSGEIVWSAILPPESANEILDLIPNEGE